MRPVLSPWRADFPVLGQDINGWPLAYLDSAATTQRPRYVLGAMNAFYEHTNANPGNALHALARRAHYTDERGHPRLRARHLPFSIGDEERDAWMFCMRGAMDEVVTDRVAREWILQRLSQVADWMRNRSGPA